MYILAHEHLHLHPQQHLHPNLDLWPPSLSISMLDVASFSVSVLIRVVASVCVSYFCPLPSLIFLGSFIYLISSLLFSSLLFSSLLFSSLLFSFLLFTFLFSSEAEKTSKTAHLSAFFALTKPYCCGA